MSNCCAVHAQTYSSTRSFQHIEVRQAGYRSLGFFLHAVIVAAKPEEQILNLIKIIAQVSFLSDLIITGLFECKKPELLGFGRLLNA